MEKAFQVSFSSVMENARVRFQSVSPSLKKQISLLALDSLPIRHEIAGFSFSPEGMPLHTKIPEKLEGPADKRAFSAFQWVICNALLQHNFPSPPLTKEALLLSVSLITSLPYTLHSKCIFQHLGSCSPTGLRLCLSSPS